MASELLVKDCSCGNDHETMPMIDISTCCCVWSDEDPNCTHEEILVPAVCIEHKRHVPCRPCKNERANSANKSE